MEQELSVQINNKNIDECHWEFFDKMELVSSEDCHKSQSNLNLDGLESFKLEFSDILPVYNKILSRFLTQNWKRLDKLLKTSILSKSEISDKWKSHFGRIRSVSSESWIWIYHNLYIYYHVFVRNLHVFFTIFAVLNSSFKIL